MGDGHAAVYTASAPKQSFSAEPNWQRYAFGIEMAQRMHALLSEWLGRCVAYVTMLLSLCANLREGQG